MMFPGEGSFVKSEQLTLTMSSGLSQHVLGDIHFLFFVFYQEACITNLGHRV